MVELILLASLKEDDCFPLPDHKVEASGIHILWAYIWQTTICLRSYIIQPLVSLKTSADMMIICRRLCV